jgi:hypothetical protein
VSSFIYHSFISHKYLPLTRNGKFTILPLTEVGFLSAIAKMLETSLGGLSIIGIFGGQFNRRLYVQGYLKLKSKKVTMIQQKEASETYNERRGL